MKDFFKTHIQIFIIVITIFSFGTLGYYFIEDNWTIFESFYMTAITITTVGYGETKPLSDIGRGFTIVLIFLGLGTAAIFATQLIILKAVITFRHILESSFPGSEQNSSWSNKEHSGLSFLINKLYFHQS